MKYFGNHLALRHVLVLAVLAKIYIQLLEVVVVVVVVVAIL